MAAIKEVKPVRKEFRRVGAHSHIRGLGLDENGRAKFMADGMVGQAEAREAAGIVVQMIREGKMAGRGVLIVGPSGTGKTAIAVGIAKELGEDTPFVAMTGSEIYSSEMKKTEAMMQALRKAIGVRFRERRTVYEGVVSRIRIGYVKHPFNPYVRVPHEAEVVLETRDDSVKLRVGEEIAVQLLQLRVRRGDVIWIDAETGEVHKTGRICEKREYDISVYKCVEKPSGPVKKEKEIVHLLTLHDLDVAYAAQRAAAASFLGMPLTREIPSDVRQRVDEEVKKLVSEGRAELVPGVLFIDDAHMLDIEAFSFLTRAMESDLAPILVLATNRGITKIRGTDIESPHGIPLDLLDRLLIIKTRPYKPEEIREILRIRADEEEVPLTEEALEELTKLGAERSLRYAVQLMEPARILAEREGRAKVTVEDVRRAAEYFVDVKESVRYIQQYEEKFLK
ncbi:TATA box-binding protein [Pyrodictium occultum]|uniref:DNA helicase n=1 Tax=Pyrodictium occultum TaxID=2309 RepID=A0A0V8RT98_PYROC|nr:RuvB-like helicase [Pyrodictium occultum]KSW11297.1 TATA box-binding protein [Pyrodictium occultum]